MVIKSYHIILAVKILGWFLLKWAGFGEFWAGNRQPDLATLVLRLYKVLDSFGWSLQPMVRREIHVQLPDCQRAAS